MMVSDVYKQAKKSIDCASKVLIISHRKPDADTLGAALCLKFWLAKEGKKITLACVDKPSSVFSFLPGVEKFVDDFVIQDYDLIIVVDAGASYMTNFQLKHKDLFSSRVSVLNIDHHASNDLYGKVNVVESDAASTTVILYKMLKEWGVFIDADMATCLLAGLYGDTGSFMHSNTSGKVYEIAADLMKKGAKIADISKNLFRLRSVSTLKLWGKVLEKAQVTPTNVVISVVRDNEYAEVNARPEELSGVIDYLNMVPESKFAVLINEDRKGNVKGSFRTRKSDVDLSKIASYFGGGGHPKASGFSVPGKLEEEVHYKIVSENSSQKFLDFQNS